jgi:hypothetical protein
MFSLFKLYELLGHALSNTFYEYSREYLSLDDKRLEGNQ